jgi:hypothetical protein
LALVESSALSQLRLARLLRSTPATATTASGRIDTIERSVAVTSSFLNYGDAQSMIGSAPAMHWYRRMQWRATAALAGLIALLIAAPLSNGHNREPWSPSSSYSGLEVARLEELQQGNIRSSAEARALAVLQTRFANPHCGEIIARIQLGEPLLDAGRALLRNDCDP